MIEVSDIQLAKRCLEAHYERCSKAHPTVPPEMRQGEGQQDGWMQWKLVTSRLTEVDVAAFEKELPFCLPSLFRAFLVSYYVLDMDVGGFPLSPLPSDAPLKYARHYLQQPSLWQIRYAQFAGAECGDPVCFDLQASTPDGDFAVVTINHDWIEPGDWIHRDRVEPHAERKANSFREFFTQLCLGDQSA